MLSAGSALKQYQTTAINKYLAFIFNYHFHHNAFVIWLLVIWIIKSEYIMICSKSNRINVIVIMLKNVFE